jgi:sigma-E factor negative regulatory protein RseC
MIEKSGVVIKTKAQFAIVQVLPASGCQHCVNHHECGTANLISMFRPKYGTVKVVNQLAAQIGDQVIIGLEENSLLRTSMIFYLLPLLGLFIGAIGYEWVVVMMQWPESEILTIGASLLGLGLGLLQAQQIHAKISQNIRYYPVIIKKLVSEKSN